MKQPLREPLLHFVLLGAILFGVYSWRQPSGDEPPGTNPHSILISAEQQRHLIQRFQRIWQREPTPEEFKGLLNDHLTEEIYYREARALGLDENDTLIRRRLRQKMEFLTQNLASTAEPADTDLAAFLEAHPERFQRNAVLGFEHVYLNPDHHPDTLDEDATALLASLRRAGANADPATLGDPIMLDAAIPNATQTEVARLFGEAFARRILELPVGEWHGPIPSGYGVHLVHVNHRTAGRNPALEEVREEVRREWELAEIAKANDTFFRGLRSKYTVAIEPLPTNATPVADTSTP